MDLRREVQITILALAFLNLTLAFGAIGLFMRMGPAIEKIIEENVVSIVAAEDMLSEFVKSDGLPLPTEARERVIAALDNAERNVTEEAERPVLAKLRLEARAAVDGEGDARRRFAEAAGMLISINREAMHLMDRRAQHLGRAGAWAAVLIGILSFVTSLLVLSRLQRRLVRPLLELHEVLGGASSGEKFRRCRAVGDAPEELLQVTRAVNQLLDQRPGEKLST